VIRQYVHPVEKCESLLFVVDVVISVLRKQRDTLADLIEKYKKIATYTEEDDEFDECRM
jgi:hypothetical protein